MARNFLLAAAAVGMLTMFGCTCADLKKQNENLKGQRDRSNEQLSKVQAERDDLAHKYQVISEHEVDMSKLVDELQKAVQERENQRKELEQIIKDMGIEGVGLGSGPEGNYILMQNEVLFELGKAELTDKARKALDTVVVAFLKKYPQQQIRIDGHTDGAPIRVSPWEDNYHLAAMRAHSVMKYLISKSISPQRMFIAGFGPNRPLEKPAKPDSSVAKNRRVEILLPAKAGRQIQDILQEFAPEAAPAGS